MNRIERMNAILIHLQGKKVVTANELADRFGIHIRTVYRDLRALEEAGIPIGAEAGIGYFLPDNYKLPPVMFTTQEATALLLAGKLATKLSDDTTAKACNSALYKVKAILKHADKERLEVLESHIEVFNHTLNTSSNLHLTEIQSALEQHTTLQINYRSYYKDEATLREVEPLGIVYYGGNWHLIAFCKLRNDFRDFRLERIESLKANDIRFDATRHPSLNNYFEHHLHNPELITIKVRFTNHYLSRIKDSKYWYGFLHWTPLVDHCECTFVNNDLSGFAKWLLWAGDSVEIIEPPALKTVIQEMVKRLYTCHLGSNPNNL